MMVSTVCGLRHGGSRVEMRVCVQPGKRRCVGTANVLDLITMICGSAGGVFVAGEFR